MKTSFRCATDIGSVSHTGTMRLVDTRCESELLGLREAVNNREPYRYTVLGTVLFNQDTDFWATWLSRLPPSLGGNKS